MTDKIEAKPWTEFPELINTKLADLVKDYKEADQAVKEAEARKEAVRVLILETITPIGAAPALVGDRRVAWVPESKTTRLDRGLLVKAGVTPAQLTKGTAEGTKKGYLKIGPVKDDGEV